MKEANRSDGENIAYQYDAAGNRTQVTHPDGYFVDYIYDDLNRLDRVLDANGLIADYDHDPLSRRTKVTYGNGAVAEFDYEIDSDLSGLSHKQAASGPTLIGYTHGYNKAGQLTSTSLTNGAYGWRPAQSGLNEYTANGLNQYTSLDDFSAITHDANGSLTADWPWAYGLRLNPPDQV